MLRNHLECDGCHAEVHEDMVEIVGDRVLCDRCREKVPAGCEYRNGVLVRKEPGC